MGKLPTEVYSIDVRELAESTVTAAVLEFWWSGRVRTVEQARTRFLEFIVGQGLVLGPDATVDVELVDEFRLLRWVVRAGVTVRA
jgi:hypothetical protein